MATRTPSKPASKPTQETFNQHRPNGKKWSRHHSMLPVHPGHNTTGRTKPSGHSVAGYGMHHPKVSPVDHVVLFQVVLFQEEEAAKRHIKRSQRAKARSDARKAMTRKRSH